MDRRWKRATGCAALAIPLMASAVASPRFEVIAHRGASADAPENTLAAFRSALAQGAVHIELDVQLTRDGKNVVFHDRDLGFKIGDSGPVARRDLAALERLDLAPWFRRRHPGVDLSAFPHRETHIVSLRSVFAALGPDPIYHVEIKSAEPELPVRALAAVRAAGLEHRVRVSSFHLAQLLRVRDRAALPLCWLLPGAEDWDTRGPRSGHPGDPAIAMPERRRRAVERAAAQGISRVAFPAMEVDRALVAYARERGVDLRVWKTTDMVAFRHAVEVGASGATVDWPAAALAWLREQKSGESGGEAPP